MKKLSFKQAEKLHRELWGWLAETGEIEKSNWPEWDEPDCDSTYNGISVENSCFACETTGDGYCNRCPIDWKNEGDYNDCCDIGSPYLKWCSSKTIQTRKKYAAIIRDLPWRKMK